VHLYPNDLYEKLEFDRILHLLEGYCMGELGRERVAELTLLTDKSTIDLRLQEAWEMKRTVVEGTPFPTRGYQNILADVQFLAVPDYVLSQEGLHRVMIVMTNMYAIGQFFKSKKDIFPALFAVVREQHFDDALYAAVRKVIDDEGNIRPDASPELGRIRRAIISKRKEIDTKFRSIINTYGSKGYLAEASETIRNGRRVLSVLAEYKRSIKGILHDESASGRTAYIEPEEIVEANNDMANFEAEERREIWRILRDLCRILQPYAPVLANYQEIVATYDVIQAKAQLAYRMNGIRPMVLETPNIQLRGAFHPLLFIRNQAEKKKTVPFTLTFQEPNKVLILSGPNAGGKSIAMKSVGLLQLMLQTGLLIPCADGTEMGIFKQIFADIGDSQSLDDDLSTYSSRLQLMKHVLERANNETLVLIDEFGSGTDPKMGGSLAESALRELNAKGVWGVVTTHYSNLKLFAYKTKGLLNGCMLFDSELLTPTYEMRVGRPGSSFAFEMAMKNGWSDDLLAYAKKRTGESETAVDQLLVDLQREKQELTEQLAAVNEKEAQLSKLIKQYDNVYKDLEFARKRQKLMQKETESQHLTQANKDLEKLVRQIQEEKNLEKAKELAAKVKVEREKVVAEKEALNENIYYTDAKKLLQETDIAKGDYVRMRDNGAVGVVESIKKNEATVHMGMMSMTVKLRDLEKIDSPLKQDKGKVVRNTIENNARFSPQLDLRGMRRDEALLAVQDFVDDALLTGIDSLRIVHGKGDGILRTSVKKKLREYRSVERIYHPEDRDGGDGVTIVEM
jgi:DNA mismatch repair protein MutS2